MIFKVSANIHQEVAGSNPPWGSHFRLLCRILFWHFFLKSASKVIYFPKFLTLVKNFFQEFVPTYCALIRNIIPHNVIQNYYKRNRFAVTNCHRCRGVFLPIQKIDLLSIVWTLVILIFSVLELLQFKKYIYAHEFEHKMSFIEEHLMQRTLVVV